jgi:hypothetical protein
MVDRHVKGAEGCWSSIFNSSKRRKDWKSHLHQDGDHCIWSCAIVLWVISFCCELASLQNFGGNQKTSPGSRQSSNFVVWTFIRYLSHLVTKENLTPSGQFASFPGLWWIQLDAWREISMSYNYLLSKLVLLTRFFRPSIEGWRSSCNFDRLPAKSLTLDIDDPSRHF